MRNVVVAGGRSGYHAGGNFDIHDLVRRGLTIPNM